MGVTAKIIPRLPAPLQQRPIIVVKGPQSPQKTLIAGKLANFFRYLLIDQDDVVLPSSLTKSTPDLALRMLLQIASANIEGAKNGVVINAELPGSTQMEEVFRLRRPTGVSLLIIQTLPVRDDDELYDGHEGHNKMYIDTSRRFVLEDILPDMICIISPESDLASGMKKRWEETDVLAQHLHVFSLFPIHGVFRKPGKSNCSSCWQDFLYLDSTYGCVECYEYMFHQRCCERLPWYDRDRVLEETRTKCPSYLTGKDLSHGFRYEFTYNKPCRHCRITGFSPECFGCLFETHVKSKILPTVINRDRIHDHVLSIVVAPFECNYTYCCKVCGLTGKHVGYKCSDCCLDFHPGCAMLPETVEKGHKHKLWLRKYSEEEFPYRENAGFWVCCECGESNDSWNWFYYCGEDECTDVLIHPNCLLKESE